MKTEKLDIGLRIKEARKKAGLHQKNIADLIGVTISAVSGYEIGSTYPPPPALAKIAHACNVTIDYLITGQEVISQDNASKPATTYKGQRLVLSDAEHMLVEAFRKGDDSDKLGLISLAVAIHKRQ